MNAHVLVITLFNAVFTFCFLFILKYKPASRRTVLKLSLFVGVPLGCIFALYVFNNYQAELPINKPTEARIIQTSAKSIVVEGFFNNNKYRARLSISNDQSKQHIFKGAYVKFICKDLMVWKKESAFATLERLQQIKGICTKPIFIKTNKTLLTYTDDLRISLRKLVYSRLSNLHENTFAHAFLMADTDHIHPRTLHLLRRMGLAHLFSASGLHLGILFGFVVILFYNILLSKKFKWIAFIAGFIIITIYLIVLDFRLSLLRAYVFVFLYLLSKLLDRKIRGAALLFTTALILEIYQPLSSFSASFILSFSVTFTIIYLTPHFNRISLIKNSYLKNHLNITLSAAVASAFLSSWIFGYFTPLSFMYNLVLVPLAPLYLIVSIVYLFWPTIDVLIQTLDYLFYSLVYLHSNFWESRHPEINMQYLYAWLILLTIFIITIVVKFEKKQHWIVFGKFKHSIIILLLLFIPIVNWRNYPKQVLFVFPYGVLKYSHTGNKSSALNNIRHDNSSSNKTSKTLSAPRLGALQSKSTKDDSSHYTIELLGEPAGFLKRKANKDPFLAKKISGLSYPWDAIKFDAVYKKLVSDHFLLPNFPSFSPNIALAVNHNKVVEIEKPKKNTKGLITNSKSCYIFLSKIEPQHWANNEFGSCRNIYLIGNKKQHRNKDVFLPLIQEYTSTDEIEFIQYFHTVEIAQDE